MGARKPPELHLIEGTTSRTGNTVMLPESIRKRVPKADWLDNPDAWDSAKFIEETAEFLLSVYGIGNDQDKHILAILAGQIQIYIDCARQIRRDNLVVAYNAGATPGANPLITIQNKAITLILQLMGELGLTPKGRLSAHKFEDESPMSKLMRGPKG